MVERQLMLECCLPIKIFINLQALNILKIKEQSTIDSSLSTIQVLTLNHSAIKNILYHMNMQMFLASFRRQIQRGPEHFKQMHKLKEIILPIAPKISERAYEFVLLLFEADSIRRLRPLDWPYEIPNPTQSPMCSSVMTEDAGIASFRCYDCMQSSSSCMCQHCFKDGNHQGHNYVQYNAVNGCCDCGNAEAWNEKGFCKTHTAINNLQIEIPKSIKRKYIQQSTLLIYIYLYICFKQQGSEKQSSQYLIELYGKYIFNHLKTISHQSYDMKLLANQLLESRLPAIYPKIVEGDLNLLQIFFMVPQEKAKAYQQLIHFFFELFPVQEHRKLILVNYFKKVKSFEDNMAKENPLAGLNFQYLSCVKLIIILIKKGELEPLQVFAANRHLKNNKSIEQIPKIYKKLYQDLDYINNMKSAKDYQIIHFLNTNVAEFAGYRQYSICPVRPQYKDIIGRFNIDQFFLKIFGKFVNHIKGQKEVLLKGIRDLFHYLANTKENQASLAQERAFAMLVVAYFNGDISRLSNIEVKKNFFASIYVHESHLQLILSQIIKRSLKTKINMSELDPPHRDVYQSYFLRINCQKNIPQFLDCIFHKILILLSQGICQFDQTVFQLLNQIWPSNGLIHQEFDVQSDQEINLQKVNKMLVVFKLFNTITRTDLDEIVIGGFLNYLNKPKIFDFFSRIVTTFKQQTAKQIKSLCMELINSQQLFQEFIVGYTIPQRGKLRLKEGAKALEYYNFNLIFQHFTTHLPQSEIIYLTGEEEKSVLYSQINIFKPSAIMKFIQSCTDIIMSLPQKCDPRAQLILNNAIIQVLKFHLTDLTIQEPKLFLDMLLNESMRVFLFKSVVEQVTIISKKEEELHKNLEKIKVQQAQQFRLKRQKILSKRKLKEEIMKKNQSQMLNKFKQLEQFNSNDSDKPTCIYCKGQKKQMLNLISYVSLTNLIQHSIFKKPSFHYFFASCGHYIHSSCYIEANSKEIRRYCFLCKRQSNILIPDLTIYPAQKSRERSDQFLNNIISALIDEYDLADGRIGKFEPLIFEQNEKILFSSFARELIYKGLHNYSYFKKKLYYLYLQIYQLIELIDKQKLKKAFEDLNKENLHQNSSKLQLLQSYLEQGILNLVPKEDYSFLPLTSQQLQQASNILKVIKQRKPETQIKQLKLINVDTIFIKIPQTLKELHLYMGKCKLCPNVTNNIFLCLTCGWSGCLKCSKQIFSHVTQQHLEGTAIIGCSTGSVKYVKGSSIFEDSSIYENYMGLNFTEADSYNEFTRTQKYNLNLGKERQVRTMMLNYEVHQKIRLNAGY